LQVAVVEVELVMVQMVATLEAVVEVQVVTELL
jgi:hypothetical protein